MASVKVVQLAPSEPMTLEMAPEREPLLMPSYRAQTSVPTAPNTIANGRMIKITTSMTMESQ